VEGSHLSLNVEVHRAEPGPDNGRHANDLVQAHSVPASMNPWDTPGSGSFAMADGLLLHKIMHYLLSASRAPSERAKKLQSRNRENVLS
jgi:hypothetical protein